MSETFCERTNLNVLSRSADWHILSFHEKRLVTDTGCHCTHRIGDVRVRLAVAVRAGMPAAHASNCRRRCIRFCRSAMRHRGHACRRPSQVCVEPSGACRRLFRTSINACFARAFFFLAGPCRSCRCTESRFACQTAPDHRLGSTAPPCSSTSHPALHSALQLPDLTCSVT